ncbi:hypothetical protein JCM4914_66570 [Streptomyces platensis subsp. malvinus]
MSWRRAGEGRGGAGRGGGEGDGDEEWEQNTRSSDHPETLKTPREDLADREDLAGREGLAGLGRPGRPGKFWKI